MTDHVWFQSGVCTEDGKGIRLIGDEEYKEWVRHDLENLAIVSKLPSQQYHM